MTAVKICGLTRLADARVAVEAGADAVGFVFYARSPRAIAPENAAAIAATLPKRVARIGVFVGDDIETIAAIAAQVGLTAVQVHGDVAPERAAALNVPVIRAWQALPPASILGAYPARLHMADGAAAGLQGGTGRAAAEGLIRAVAGTGRPWMLAGGLAPETVGAAIRRWRPDIVDVSSGVESAPGIKDAAKMRAFVAAVRAEGVGRRSLLDLFAPEIQSAQRMAPAAASAAISASE